MTEVQLELEIIRQLSTAYVEKLEQLLHIRSGDIDIDKLIVDTENGMYYFRDRERELEEYLKELA